MNIGMIEFNGHILNYPNGYAIHCKYNDEFESYSFDVLKDGDYIKQDMCYLHQAHELIVRHRGA